MDSSQHALQTNGKLFSNLKLVFENFSENQIFLPKTENIPTYSEARIFIKFAIHYISMDSS